MKTILAALAVAIFVGVLGAGTELFSQESGRREAPRLTPEERRSRWNEMRGRTPEQRRARLEELREERLEARPESERVEATEEQRTPEGSIADDFGGAEESLLSRLEFRSVIAIDGVTEFSLHDTLEERTFLISSKEGRNGLEVIEFKPETNALTLRHGEETRTLYLRAARVAEVEQSQQLDSEQARRQERWRQRREQFQQFRSNWEQAAAESPELRQIETHFQELMRDYGENRSQLESAADGTPEHAQLREQQQAMREEFRLLTEYSVMEMRKNPAFAQQDVDMLERMLRGMMFRSNRDRNRDGGRSGGEGWRRGRPQGSENP